MRLQQPRLAVGVSLLGPLERCRYSDGVRIFQRWRSALPSIAGLTARQLDVMHCLLKGGPNKLIARELGLVEGTVKMHIAAILRALHARNRTEAVIKAKGLGLVDPEARSGQLY